MEDDSIIQVQIHEQKHPGDNWDSSTMFKPQGGTPDQNEKRGSSNPDSNSMRRPAARAPEKKLTLFALRLAILEKLASGLGKLGFVWATVVLLGGFAVTLDKIDFWVITVILVIEGTRIFSRSQELEWQHQATWSFSDATERAELDDNVRKTLSRTRTWATSDVPFLPYARWVFLSRNVSTLLYLLQLFSALVCVTLSVVRLVQQDFGEISKGDSDKRNRNSALNIFYSLALAEALLFLLEKAYMEWEVLFCKLLEKVNEECNFGSSGMVSIKKFFYDSFAKCVNGGIFDGLKMDLVSFAVELLASDSSDEQQTGTWILRKFATDDRFSDDTLQKIGVSKSVIERLVEMLNWKDPEEKEIRRSAAEILSTLAEKKQNSLRVAGIPGAVESISSLLYTGQSSKAKIGEICQGCVVINEANNEFASFNHLGLLILKKLARDHDNCGKIGNTRGLLPKIVDFTRTGERFLKDDHVTESQIITVKQSLQLVKILSSTTGETGNVLRRGISEIVFTVSNIRDILHYGENYPSLQKLGIDILTSLALEDDATEKIGSTGGILKFLFQVFLKQEMPGTENSVKVAAGEALAMLAFESENNCGRILKLGDMEKLVSALRDRELQISSGRILRNLCAYSSSNYNSQLREIISAAPYVLEQIMSEENKRQEVMVGLAAQIFRLMKPEDSSFMFEETEITEIDLATKLVQILKDNEYPTITVPRIRRYTIELIMGMMKNKEENIQIFKNLGAEMDLKNVIETTSELESCNVFSGTTGLSKHKKTISSLVETTIELLAKN